MIITQKCFSTASFEVPSYISVILNFTAPLKCSGRKLLSISLKIPMNVSGMAKRVFSVATRKGPCTESPTPWRNKCKQPLIQSKSTQSLW